jgi:hypothetical protein
MNQMKKPYAPPLLSAAMAELGNMICGSVRSTNGIGYGGIDEDGEKTPSARRNDIWGIDED